MSRIDHAVSSNSVSSRGRTTESSSSSSVNKLQEVHTKRIFISRIRESIQLLKWPESCVQISRSSRGEFSDGIKEREEFDLFCRLYNLLFFFREPHIQQIENFKEVFGQHIVIQDETKIVQNKLWICFQDYFDKYFKSTNGEQAPSKKQKASKGWYLFKQYKITRNEIFLEWQRIFWRPSHTVTGHCLKGIDPSLTECRPTCPFILAKMGFEGLNCFGFQGRIVEKHGGVSLKPTLHLKTLVYENGIDHNPFNWLVTEAFALINDVFVWIGLLFGKQTIDRNDRSFPKTDLPSLPLSINSLLKLGDLQFVLDLLCGYISPLKQMFAHVEDVKDDFNQLEVAFKNLRRFLEHTDMHVFLAAWTLWDRPDQPYIVNFLMRAKTVNQFHMLLTEEFLGTFYMVCFNFTHCL